ncbi:MAG: tRNA-dihydrouridine synthase [Halobacteriales archaeon]
MFAPRVALASLSGEADADWARDGADHAGAAFLGGIALDDASRAAATAMVEDRNREEFLPADPIAFIDDELAALADAPLRPAFNVRSASVDPLCEAAAVCARHDAIVEINAHCRQRELRAAGCGETLLADPARLSRFVAAAADTGATVSVKVRAEVQNAPLPAVAARIDEAGADAIHVDAMDSEPIIADVVDAADLFVIANNGVRGRETAHEYLAHGADAVSVGRASDRPAVLSRVRKATAEWFGRREVRA